MNKPKRAGDNPRAIELEAEKSYAWCACGFSENQPFCDGSHKGSGFSPKIFKVEKSDTYYLCMCKQTGNSPFCDGSHKQ